MAAFASTRHPDTVDARGPYRVSAHQLCGPQAARGAVVYTVWDAHDRKLADGRVGLRPAAGGEGWAGEIPGQPAGSTITYSFSFVTRGGDPLRHPARTAAGYRFRVVAVKILSLSLPEGRENSSPAVLRVEAASRPAGELVFRLLSTVREPGGERRVPLAVEKQPGSAADPAAYLLRAPLPELRPGEATDFYFRLRSGGGAEITFPADAPSRSCSVKRPLRTVRSLGGDGTFVLDLAALGRQHWLGLKGGGLWRGPAAAGEAVRGLHLPSRTVRFVAADAVAGQVYAGTDRGVVAIDAAGGAEVALAVPRPSAWGAAPAFLDRLGRGRSAGPGALSSLDGSVLFQLQGQGELEQRYPASVLAELRDGKLAAWKAPALALAGISALAFDAADGCWLLGGLAPGAKEDLDPVAVRHCGGPPDRLPLRDFDLGGHAASPRRIIALGRDPATGGWIAAVELAVRGDPRQLRQYGVYRIDERSGGLSPLAPGLASVGAEITSLAADWRRGRLLVGTFGRGILVLEGGALHSLAGGATLPAEVTTVRVDEASGTLLVGTSRGAYQGDLGGLALSPLGPSPEAALPPDLLPTDVDPATGRVLLSSYSSGLVELARQEGRWRLSRFLRSGRELPTGLFGDAQYTAGGGLAAIVHSQGIVVVEDRRATLLGPGQGLHARDVLRLLARRAGDLWLAFTPLPVAGASGAAFQVVHGTRPGPAVAIDDRNLATIARWIEVPERRSAFAATRAGVVEIREDGAMTPLSRSSASSVARDPATGAIGAAGSAVERWDGKRFTPVLFRVDHPRWPRGEFQPGQPIDLAIDRTGLWCLLFPGGLVVWLDPDKAFLGLLDAEDGIPGTAQRLLAHPESGEIFVGSSAEGPVLIQRPPAPPARN